MLNFINRIVQIYFIAGHTIKGQLTDFSEDFLSLTEISGKETIIFRPMENILMIRMVENEVEVIEELEVPDAELPMPKINYTEPHLIARDIGQQRVSQIQQHHQDVKQFLTRSQKSAPTIKYEFPSFKK